MKRLCAWLRALVQDTLFVRVCVAIYGALIGTLGMFGLIHWVGTPFEWVPWAISTLIVGIGLLAICAAVFGSISLLERVGEVVNDGGEVLGLVLLLVVIAVAVPITAAIRAVRDARL